MATTASPKRPGDQDGYGDSVRELFVHATRIQLAAITAASRFVAGWAQSADRYAQAVSGELLGRVHGEVASSALVGRLAEATGAHLREVTTLPGVAVDHFNDQISKPHKRRPRPTRRATPSTRSS
jgi:hypothetical protein